jgi:hypothetical protein
MRAIAASLRLALGARCAIGFSLRSHPASLAIATLHVVDG